MTGVTAKRYVVVNPFAIAPADGLMIRFFLITSFRRRVSVVLLYPECYQESNLPELMAIRFYKYQGAGNDFIMIDDRDRGFDLEKEAIAALCDRRFGIGADGLILLQDDRDYDFRMVYFNADGGEGSLCGNGGRCAVRFAGDLGLIGTSTRFTAVDGEHVANLDPKVVRLGMGDVNSIETLGEAYFLNTGSPHYVEFVADVDKTDVVGKGRAVRYGALYGPRGGTNVNFAEVVEENHLRVRTYERGVEDETLACGTGVTGCALVAAEIFGWTGPVKVDARGGELSVEFNRTAPGGVFSDIRLTGPATYVFQGTI